MRKFLPFILLLLAASFSITKAQTPDYCGTELSETQKNWLLDYAQNGRGFASKSAVQYYVPLYMHILGDDADKGFYGANQLMSDICELNDQYASVGFYFYLAGFDYISNTAWYDHASYGPGSTMMRQNNKKDVANIYVVANPAGNCGYFSPGQDGIALGKNCMGKGSTTFAHELGHFFSLPHPFTNVTGVKEYVNGSNCAIAGDLFCDTRADFLDYRWPCPYTGNEKDNLGDPYDPDETLYMSYSLDRCANRFSLEQIDAVVYNINSQRTNLQGPVQDTMPVQTKLTRLLPLEGVAQKPTNATFSWRKDPKAIGYVLQASQISVFPGNLPLDVITADTFYIATKLSDSRTYRWRVRPIYAGQTCTEFSDTGAFYTSVTASITTFGAGNNAVKLYPNPASNSQEVFIAFENDQTVTQATIYTVDGKMISAATIEQQSNTMYKMNISALKAGVYFVDITTKTAAYRQKILVE